ncbi:MAG: hypothetical protein J6M65_05240 [Eubacterium sp.]|nr:hypothetical protein [Eubacterium sp.]
MTVIELVCFALISLLAIEYSGRKACGLLIILILTMIVIEYSKYGLSVYVPEGLGKVFNYLGKISLPMYFIQSVFRRIRAHAFVNLANRRQIIVIFVCIVISSMLLNYIVAHISKLYQKRAVEKSK